MVAVFKDTPWQDTNPQHCEKHQHTPLREEISLLATLPSREYLQERVIHRFHPIVLHVLQEIGLFIPLLDYSVIQVLSYYKQLGLREAC